MSNFRFDKAAALLPAPGMALMLAGSALPGYAIEASIAAGAAFAVGFGTIRQVRGSRWRAMAITAAGMTLGAMLGTLAGNDRWATLAGTMVLGGLCGALGRRGIDGWWIALQVMVAFLLATQVGGTTNAAMHRGLLVAAGAFGQMALTHVIALMVRHPPVTGAPVSTDATPLIYAQHALRGALGAGIALMAAHAFGLAHAYWAPFTVALILKPGLRDTATRGIERVGGTAAGLVIASTIARASLVWPAILLPATMVATILAFGLQKARYSVLSAAITASVVLMIARAGGPVLIADRDRLIATVIGGTVALAAASLAPRRPPSQRRLGDVG